MLAYRPLFLAAFAALIISQSLTAQSVTADLAEGATITVKIAPNLPAFTFKVIPNVGPTDPGGDSQSTVQDVEVFRGNSREPMQHLTGCDWRSMEPPRNRRDWFRSEDFNFDGYKDIYVLTNWGENEYGCVWLYNPVSGKFDFSTEYSSFAWYWLYPVTKTIVTFGRGGMAGSIHNAEKYRVENGHLVLIYSEQQDWDQTRNQFHCEVEELRAGALVTVRDEWNVAAPCDSALALRAEADEAVAVEQAHLYKQSQQQCDQGNANGCTNLGFIYERGDGVAKNMKLAFRSYETGCQLGDLVGCSDLGILYETGDGVPRDAKRALELYQKACDGSEANGCTDLGLMYESGEAVPKNLSRAVQLYQKGCDEGSAAGCTNLGILFENGDGVARDRDRAVQLYEKGCYGNDDNGCTHLQNARGNDTPK